MSSFAQSFPIRLAPAVGDRAAERGGSMNAKAIAKIAAEAAQAAVAAAIAAEAGDSTDETAAKPKGRTSKAKAPAKAASARGKREKKVVTVWKVSKAWKGQPPHARMIGSALYYGIPASEVEGLDKYELSLCIGNFRKARRGDSIKKVTIVA